MNTTASETHSLPHLNKKPVTIWLTGLSGSGKSTIATLLETELRERDHAVFVLDGDILRTGLNRNLGFSAQDRTENVRRTAEVARLMNLAGLTVIVALISPFLADRNAARSVIGTDRFVEVFVDAPLDVCVTRDPKGLYGKAYEGKIPEFTGISSPYEAPQQAEIHLLTATTTPAHCVAQLLAYLLNLKLCPELNLFAPDRNPLD